MDPAVARRTQESLGKVIRKPPLTDKLLAKPPFRYLHDILTEVIRTTGFFKGLYTESELKSEKDKDAKISFLQKAVDVVTLVTGEPLAVKPARVVAGHEPEKTNEFLQAIGKCCLNKLSSDDAVKRILSGDKVDLKGKPPSSTKSQDKENREAKDEERRSHKEKEDKRETEIRERSGSQDRKDRQVKEEEKKEREKRKERERNGEPERDGLREGEKNEKEKNKVRESRSETDKERSKEKSEREKGRERERRSEGSHGKQKDRTREKARERDRDKERNLDKEKDLEHRNRDRDSDHGERSRDREQEKSRTRDRDKERKREGDPERERRKERGRDNDLKIERDEMPQDQKRTEDKHRGSEESTRKTSEVSSGKEKLITDKESFHAGDEKPPVQSKNSRPSASKLRERRPAKPTGEGEAASDEEGGAIELHNSESPNIAETNIAAQRKIPRPGSARPAPPRVRRQASAEVVVPERVSSGKGVSNVIVDKQKDNGDDDDNEFVVEEASPPLSEMPKMELEPELDLLQDEKHGGLVKKILETKKDYETQKDGISKDKLLLTDTGKKKEKDLVTKEIEKLRGSIQILCRSALPLGKMMDYIQEDMDTMKNELQMWRTENRQHAEVLLREQSVTDTAVDPLKAELAELEQLVREQRDKICTVKGNIMRNEEKIQKMIQSIVTSGRD